MNNINEDINKLIKSYNHTLLNSESRYQLEFENNTLCICDRNYNAPINIAIIPLKLIKNIYRDKNTCCKYVVTAIHNMVPLEELTATGMQIINPKFYIEHWFINIFPDNFKNPNCFETLTEVFSILCNYCEIEEKYNYVGFDNNLKNYIYDNIIITKNEMKYFEKNSSEDKYGINDHTLNEVLSFSKENTLQTTKDPLYSNTIFLFNILSMLSPAFLKRKSEKPCFILAIEGKSGTRKTSLTYAVTNPYKIKTFNFEDTAAVLKQGAKEEQNCCFYIDDLNITDRSKSSKLQDCIRLFSDSSTNSKKIYGGKIEDKPVQSLCMVSAETLPKLQLSSMVRMIVLPFEKDTVINEKLTILQSNPQIVVMTYIYIIEYYLNHPDEIDNIVKEKERIRDEIARENSGQSYHSRYFSAYGWLCAIYNSISNFFAQNNVKLNYDYNSNLKTHILTQAEKYHNNPMLLFLKSLLEMKYEGEISISNIKDFKKNPHSDIIEINHMWFIRNKIVYSKVSKYCNGQLNITEKSLRRNLKEQEILYADKNKLTKEIKDNNNQSYYGFLLMPRNIKKYLNIEKEI